jgi:hypothetical protein
MGVEITPEPTDEEREAILAALAEEPPAAHAPWVDPLGDDQEP